MLTRRMAKRQHCPLMPTTKTYKYHANGAGIAYEVIEYGRCMGEGYPKWRDGNDNGKGCSDEENGRENRTRSANPNYCGSRTCPERYGCCGG